MFIFVTSAEKCKIMLIRAITKFCPLTREQVSAAKESFSSIFLLEEKRN